MCCFLASLQQVLHDAPRKFQVTSPLSQDFWFSSSTGTRYLNNENYRIKTPLKQQWQVASFSVEK